MSLSRQTSTGSSGSSRKASIGSLNRKASTESTGSGRRYSTSGSYNNGIAVLTENISVLPKLIVFDLDYTLWPLWIEMYSPPFHLERNEPQVRDKGGRIVNPYPDVKDIIVELKESGIELGIASRTPEIKGARRLVETLGWDKYIPFKEIYPGCKTTHFENLCKHTHIPLSEMLFFDDEERNIKDLTAAGVVSCLVDDRGVTRKAVRDGLLKFEKERSHDKEVQSK
ncbi:hypothetical protein DAPPUDRAFT_55201 [Daphnia pulex]|uniref:Magnesium-dependent phosphatase 1 n=1 Tax=Daphnia pulex TaxID=6669 RepID=E9GVS0_DAPPU|nr:hypothetical protein DAPPUDRAFT_55201 [Daphnia pulex]|eukprot:EFX76478.1 hypothetical protein DAPPUDRAFT_55201 [Daphnia pulex]